MKEQEELKEYTLISPIKAKLFQEGDEDGFVTRYYDDNDVDADGTIHTSGISGANKALVPYIETEKTRTLSHGFGTEYVVIQNGVKKLIPTIDFLEKYKLVD